MLRIEAEPETLGAFLSAASAPRILAVRCERGVDLLLHLEGVDSRIEVLGKALPRLDVTVALTARAVSEALLELRLEVREVAGLGPVAARLVPHGMLTRKLADALTGRLGVEEGVEAHEDGTIRVFLDRLRSGSRPWLARLRCRTCEVPGADGSALRLAFALAPQGA